MPNNQEKIATLFQKLTSEEQAATISTLTEIYHDQIKTEQSRLAKLQSLIPQNGKQ